MTEELTTTVVECENGDVSVVPKRFLKCLKDPNFRWECGCGKGMNKKGLQTFVPKGSELQSILCKMTLMAIDKPSMTIQDFLDSLKRVLGNEELKKEFGEEK